MVKTDKERLDELEMREVARAAFYQYGVAVDTQDLDSLRATSRGV